MIRYSSLVVVCAAMFISFQDAGDRQDSQLKPEKTIVVPDQDPDSIARRDFMRTKLMYSQNIFEGLTTGNFNLIKAGIKEVEMVTQAQQWVSIDNEQYRKLTEDFKTATTRLKVAAETGNIDATSLRFYQLSTSCIDCHSHIRKVGYEF